MSAEFYVLLWEHGNTFSLKVDLNYILPSIVTKWDSAYNHIRSTKYTDVKWKPRVCCKFQPDWVVANTSSGLLIGEGITTKMTKLRNPGRRKGLQSTRKSDLLGLGTTRHQPGRQQRGVLAVNGPDVPKSLQRTFQIHCVWVLTNLIALQIGWIRERRPE